MTVSPTTNQQHSTTEATAHLEQLAEQVDRAYVEVCRLDEPAQSKAKALKQAIEAFHKAGLTLIVKRLKDDPHGKQILFELAEHPAVYALFSMHGLVRSNLAARVSRVIEMVRPYMQSHGGDVELADIHDDVVHVRLVGACNGCSMSSVTVRETLEQAFREHVPEVREVVLVDESPSTGFVSLDSLQAGAVDAAEHGWVQGPRLRELTPGKPLAFDFDNVSVLLVRLDSQVYAFRNACAHQGLPLEGASLDLASQTLTCPWHGMRFDCTSGECLSAPAAQLEQFPLRVEDEVIWVRPR